MNNLFAVLEHCYLFNNLPLNAIIAILENINYNLVSYKRNKIIALEGDECSSLGIILKGSLEIKRIYASGKTVTMAHLTAGNTFGEAIVFSKTQACPATISALDDCKILLLSRKNLIEICSKNPIILENLLELFSERVFMLNKKVKDLSFATIRQKICNYLLEEYNKQKNFTLKLSLSRKSLAENMGVQRPSLSRELVKMKKEGLIDFHKNIIVIKNIQALEDSLFK